MKKLILSSLIFTHFFLSPPSGAWGVYAQSVTIDPASTASNIIDAKSTNLGITVPKMTAAQKIAILTKTEGMMVYDTDAKQFSYWTGTVWVNFGNTTSAGTGWSQSGNDISNTNTGKVIINTAIPSAESKFEVSNLSYYGNAIKGNSSGQFGVGLWGNHTNGGIGVFGESTGPAAIGGYFVAYGSTSKALNIEGYNGGTGAFITSGGLGSNGLIVDQGNIGFGNLSPTAAKLVVDSPPSIFTNAVFGSNGTGISLQKNWPGVGYNSYRDAANVQRYMGNGFGMVTALDQVNGVYFWNKMGSGIAGDPVGAKEQYIAGLNQSGMLDVRSLNVGGNANNLPTLPNNSLRVNGGVYMPLKTITTNYSVQDGDYTLDVENTSGGITSIDIILPNPTLSINFGRILNITSQDLGNLTVNIISTPYSLISKLYNFETAFLLGGSFYEEKESRKSVTIQCKGSNATNGRWIVISEDYFEWEYNRN
jgi:hypothetical protein